MAVAGFWISIRITAFLYPLLLIAHNFRFGRTFFEKSSFSVSRQDSEDETGFLTPLLPITHDFRFGRTFHYVFFKILHLLCVFKGREVFIPLYFLLQKNFDLTTGIASKFINFSQTGDGFPIPLYLLFPEKRSFWTTFFRIIYKMLRLQRAQRAALRQSIFYTPYFLLHTLSRFTTKLSAKFF